MNYSKGARSSWPGQKRSATEPKCSWPMVLATASSTPRSGGIEPCIEWTSSWRHLAISKANRPSRSGSLRRVRYRADDASTFNSSTTRWTPMVSSASCAAFVLASSLATVPRRVVRPSLGDIDRDRGVLERIGPMEPDIHPSRHPHALDHCTGVHESLTHLTCHVLGLFTKSFDRLIDLFPSPPSDALLGGSRNRTQAYYATTTTNRHEIIVRVFFPLPSSTCKYCTNGRLWLSDSSIAKAHPGTPVPGWASHYSLKVVVPVHAVKTGLT